MINLQISQKVQKRRKKTADQNTGGSENAKQKRQKDLQEEEANAADPAKGVPFHQKKPRQMSIPILVKMREKADGSKM